MAKRWGATPEEWAWAKKLAKVDLLPVVSNPHAQISPRSKMKGLGKTPSVYNAEGLVSGFTDWTEHETTVRNIDAWSKEPDYGVCIQTRRIRALDIDVPDEELADQIAYRFAELIEDGDGPAMGLRTRPDSGKRLLAFIAEGELGKRSFVVKEWQEWDDERGKDVTKRWIVELLADGQQFIAAGTHTDGARYQWAGGPPAELPRYSMERLDRAWRVLCKEFALPESERRAERRDPTLIEDLDVTDPVAEHLVEHWQTYGLEKGMLYVECPWAGGHSSDNGETQTAWLLAGSGKYRNGHFRCMHAGCSAKSDADFFQAVGYRPAKADDFDDLTAEIELYERLAPTASAKSKELKAEKAMVAKAPKLPLPGFNRDSMGRIETSLENIVTALQARQACDCDLAFDEFRGDLTIADQPGEWRPFTDADAVRLRIRLEALGFKDKIGKELMRDALELVGDERRFDSAQLWLTELVPEWDGVARLHRFWPDYMNTEDSDYTRAMGLYSWTAQAGRILEPGCQVDMVPVLVSPEGYAKTSVIAALAPSRDFFAEFDLHSDDDKLARLMRGTLVGELSELRGISARDGEAIKSWITRREEKWTPKYREYATTLARRLVFYGTTNDDTFLQAHMGKRRWLPVHVLHKIDVAKIARDRMQLWAEARDTWLYDGGVAWEEVERLAEGEREQFQDVDTWEERIAAWLDEEGEIGGVTPRTSGTLQLSVVLAECCGVPSSKAKKADQQRAAAILKRLGMGGIQLKLKGRNTKVWVDNSDWRLARKGIQPGQR